MSADEIRVNQSRKSSAVRALTVGKEQITPAFHAAITNAGLDTRNMGAAMAGSASLALMPAIQHHSAADYLGRSIEITEGMLHQRRLRDRPT